MTASACKVTRIIHERIIVAILEETLQLFKLDVLDMYVCCVFVCSVQRIYLKYIIIAKEKKLKIDVYNINKNISMIFKFFLYSFVDHYYWNVVFRSSWCSYRTQLFRDLDSRTHVDRDPLQDWSTTSRPSLYRDKYPVAINSLYKYDSPDAATTSSRTTEINLSASDLDPRPALRHKPRGKSSFVIESPQLIMPNDNWYVVRAFFHALSHIDLVKNKSEFQNKWFPVNKLLSWWDILPCSSRLVCYIFIVESTEQCIRNAKFFSNYLL